MSKNYDFTFAQREEGFDDHIEHSIRGYKNLLEDIISPVSYTHLTLPTTPYV